MLSVAAGDPSPSKRYSLLYSKLPLALVTYGGRVLDPDAHELTGDAGRFIGLRLSGKHPASYQRCALW
jgi:hypothetical protein